MTLPIALHLCTELSVGGAENHLLMLLGDMQRDRRYLPHVAAFRDAAGSMRSLKNDFVAQGIPVHILGQISAADPRGPLHLMALLKRIKPTVLHTHLFRGDIFGPPLGALFRVPVRVSTVHNVEERFRQVWSRALFRMSYCFNHRVIAISDAVAIALQRLLHLPKDKISRIYYGFNPRGRWKDASLRNVRAEMHISDNDFVIGTVGRISAQKGQWYLIEALGLLKDEFPNVKLLIVGAAEPDGTMEKLQSLVRQLGLNKQVIFCGYQDDIRSMMQVFDVFVLPSLWEGFGLVLLEAMSMGKPIIASRVDAIPEIVEDGIQGILVKPADSRLLRDAVKRIMMSNALRRSLSLAGPARVAQFSPKRNLDEIIDLYNYYRPIDYVLPPQPNNLAF